MPSIQHIYFCADNKYVPFTAVTMASILVNALPKTSISFHVIGNDISDVEKARVMELKNIKSCEIEFITIDDKIFDKFKNKMEMGYLSMACFYRFLIPSLAPKEAEKVLYLDGDMIVTGSLDELFAQDLNGYRAGVVEEFGAQQAINLSLKSKRYFNSGMMLFNLKEINAEEFLGKGFDYFNSMKAKIVSHDQDILNGILDEKVRFLEQKYNVPSFVKDEKNPLIIHYTGFVKKPWVSYSRHPLKKEWMKYAQMTAYRRSFLKLVNFRIWEFFSKFFLVVKDPTHKKYYVVHLLGIRFGIGKKDNKKR